MVKLDPSEIAGWCGGEWSGAVSENLTGVSNDSRRTAQGNLYVALRGDRFDGHAFVADAFAAGAGGALVRRDWRPPNGNAPGPLLRVESPPAALRKMAAAYRAKLAAPVVGITGSAGKTTVKELTASMLRQSMKTASSPGNWNNDIGLPLSIMAMDADAEIGVFELGTNHPGEIGELSGILAPNWGLVTNIGPGHIGFFGSLEAIAREKAALIESLPVDGTAVLNADSACFEVLRRAARCRVITVGLSGQSGADYVCVERDIASCRARIREAATGAECELDCLAPGACNVTNALLAAAVARGHGIQWHAIARAARERGALPMRWERSAVAGVTVINDAYNSNPLSARAALNAFAEENVSGSRWLALADMLELGEHAESEHRRLGADLASGPWRGVVTVGRAGAWIADGAEEAGLARNCLCRCGDNREAAEFLAARLGTGDAVLLKASRGMRLEELANYLRELL